MTSGMSGFQGQKPLLHAATARCGVCTRLAAGKNDAVARDDQGDAIGRQAVSYRAGSPRRTGFGRQFAVGEKLPIADFPTLLRDAALKRAQSAKIDADITEVVRMATAIGL
jgi:hypothetical protein